MVGQNGGGGGRGDNFKVTYTGFTTCNFLYLYLKAFSKSNELKHRNPFGKQGLKQNADAVRAWNEDSLVAKDVVNQNYAMGKGMQPSSCQKEM